MCTWEWVNTAAVPQACVHGNGVNTAAVPQACVHGNGVNTAAVPQACVHGNGVNTAAVPQACVHGNGVNTAAVPQASVHGRAVGVGAAGVAAAGPIICSVWLGLAASCCNLEVPSQDRTRNDLRRCKLPWGVGVMPPDPLGLCTSCASTSCTMLQQC